MSNKVAVVIPVYKTVLKEYEEISLTQCCKVLGAHHLFLIKPEELDHAIYTPFFRNSKFYTESFSSHFFKDIKGYNNLMLSAEFYQRFSNYDFILIYQTDAFVFKDELQFWCRQGFDYIGAPWVERYKWKRKIRSHLHYRFNRKQANSNQPTLLQFYNRVGNGGFSLRRTEKFYNLCKTERDLIDFYNANNDSKFFNEDVFWSLEVNRLKKRLNIPDYKEAMHFSIEQQPELAMKLMDNELPFGLHGINIYPDFWRPYIHRAGYLKF
ncbi:hypothetical protein LL912_11915 [Niabella sp. CC-SYL272]|uniref:DUF5672 family protein n=1 Tax=Niabella agricola TaxID=2891571 RepID=UPI001F291070|nr:DUF5672 family protein [Niabella agricola]MCF3109478.1 hypothetical protein [Niabella agricola]